ncbi:GFA family protein [Anderseniella sp. Alg231-50]|uniref:GFA family protein n=1 Tax=Anderseniella sp. Alg231-50 TaxID=1922226 RepID=UPI000D551F8A
MVFSGGCQCGTIRYDINSKPVLAYCCHCTDCQRQSSSAFGMSVWFPASAFTLTSGALLTWTTRGDSGNEKTCTLCPDCGTRIYHSFPDQSDTLSVKGGSLDKIHEIDPVAHIWTRSAQPWVLRLIDGELCHETEPENFDHLVARFQRKPD